MDLFTSLIGTNLIIAGIVAVFHPYNFIVTNKKPNPLLIKWMFITLCSLPVWLFITLTEHIWGIITL